MEAPRRFAALHTLWLVFGVLSGAAQPQQAPAVTRFEDTSVQRGILPSQPTPGMGTGVAAADFDGDGDIDLFVPTGSEPHRLYRNDGAGHYTEVAAALGVDSPTPGRTALFIDSNGDHRLDLLIANENTAPLTLQLFEQQASGTFQDVTVGSGFDFDYSGLLVGGMCAGDLDGDDYLDVYVSVYVGLPWLLRNKGNGSFQDVSTSSSIRSAGSNTQWQPIMADFNCDGLLDIYVAVDFSSNLLWINQGNLSFVDQAVPTGSHNHMNDMGIALGDYDRDGDFDLYITNVFTPEANKHNVLYRNDSNLGSLVFREVSEDLGVDQGHWGWGATFFDANNDGRLDLAATNGFFEDQWYADPSRFFLNVGPRFGRFLDQSANSNLQDHHWGSALVAADSDRDGDLDLIQACNDGSGIRLLENTSRRDQRQRYLNVRPRMEGANHFAIGTVVTANLNGVPLPRLLSAGCSYMGQEPAEAHFGLGAAKKVETLEVRFPDGSVSLLHDVQRDQHLFVTPPPLTSARIRGESLTARQLLSLKQTDEETLLLDEEQIAPTLELTWQTEVQSPALVDLSLEASAAHADTQVTVAFYNSHNSRYENVTTVNLGTAEKRYDVTDLPVAAQISTEGVLRVGLWLIGPQVQPRVDVKVRIDELVLHNFR